MLLQKVVPELDPWHERQLINLGPFVDGERALWPAPQRMREVLGACDLSNAVVTSYVDGPVGFACRSVATLSLNPPLMTFAPARTSLTWAQIRRTGRFCVNVLSVQEQTYSTRFASLALDRFDGVLWTTSPGGCPVLANAIAWIECQVRAEHDGGDHRIVVADVLALAPDQASLPAPFLCSSYGD